jgi:hypothetical protein
MDALWVMKWNLAGRRRSDFQNASHYLPFFAFDGKLPWGILHGSH